MEFLSTPSGWRATTSFNTKHRKSTIISIHALRVEGDISPKWRKCIKIIFLSTPSGWRATRKSWRHRFEVAQFLSTPSGWRATRRGRPHLSRCRFLSTPSGWRATGLPAGLKSRCQISIHALRVEGDGMVYKGLYAYRLNFYPRPPGGGRPMSPSTTGIVPGFLSTPSGWRATKAQCHFARAV